MTTIAHTPTNQLPWTICPTCKGEGTTGPGWVYTQDDRDEMGEEWFEHAEDLRAGRFDIKCTDCDGRRVVRAECQCDDCDTDRLELADMEAMTRAELRAGC